MILTRHDLLPELRRHLAKAQTLDLAVAWATPSPALEAIVKFAEKAERRPRVIVGISGNATSPLALKELFRVADLKLTQGEQGTFHPKFYRFVSGASSICWVGSANLTTRGFGINDELVHASTDDNGICTEWFNKLWSSLEAASQVDIDQYEQSWTPTPPPEPRSAVRDLNATDPAEAVRGYALEWEHYVTAIEKADAFWKNHDFGFSVLGETFSYLNTIQAGHLVARQEDWSALSKEQTRALLGLYAGEDRSGYGLLGSLGGAGTVVQVFTEDTTENIRQRNFIRECLQPLASADDFPAAAAEALEQISGLKRFAEASATRFITLFRPDAGVSVNKKSRFGLAELTGLSQSTLGKPENYEKLLRWVERQPWHSAPQPNDYYEQTLWAMRAALLDAFVYDVSAE